MNCDSHSNGDSIYRNLRCDVVESAIIQAPGAAEKVDIYMMRENVNHTAWHVSFVAYFALHAAQLY